MEETVMKENKMGVMPIGKLIITMSLPIMISMLVQALYNVVDSIFVARVSENALTAVSMAFPIQSLMIAVGVGTAVGVNALLARSLGAKDMDRVNKIAENAVFLAVMSYLVFLLIGLLLSEPFFRSQTYIEEIVQYGKQYLTICCCTSFGIFVQIMFERMLQATGKTFYTMITQGTGAIINIILDPILIFGLFGFPRMEVAGVVRRLRKAQQNLWQDRQRQDRQRQSRQQHQLEQQRPQGQRQHLQHQQQHRNAKAQQHLQQDLQDRQLIVLQMVSAEAMATVRRVTVMDRDAETDRDITEATVRRATVTDRDAETDRDTTEATVRRATVTDRDAETDQHTTEATVRRVTVMDRDVETDRDTTVTDRDVVEIVRDITEATVRRMVDVTAVEDRAQEVVQAVR